MRTLKHFLTHPKDVLSSTLKKYGKWIPDSLYLRWQYRLLMGKKLDLKNPQTFTEKIQWLKIHNRRPIMTTMVDKYAVKEHVAQRIGEKYIIPTLGVWNSLEEVDWDSLPEKFVLKTTHGGGGTGVVVVKDKSKADRIETLNKLRWSYKDEGYTRSREWPYKNVPRRIIAEQLIEIQDKSDLTDYKIFCFNGEPKYIQVIQDRHSGETIDFYDTDWNHQEFVGLNPRAKNAATPVARPHNLDAMLDAARKLAKDDPFVRVDMYQIEEGILFGELTFFPASGIGAFTPEDTDEMLGELLQLPDSQNKKKGGVNG